MEDMKTSDHLWAHDHNSATGRSGDKYLMCINEASVGSKGFWLHKNPMHYSTPILLLQLFISSTTSIFFNFLLRPLGQTSTVSNFLGGLVFGPSFLGHHNILGSTLFPARGLNIFETSAMFGLFFFLFLVAVKGDASMMLRPGRAAIIVGASLFITSLALTITYFI